MTRIPQHTPGPWTLQEHETEPCQLIGNGTIRIADIFFTDFPEGKCDARLIAAAPDLLEACEAAGDALDEVERNMVALGGSLSYLQSCARIRIRAAISKAKGQQARGEDKMRDTSGDWLDVSIEKTDWNPNK